MAATKSITRNLSTRQEAIKKADNLITKLYIQIQKSRESEEEAITRALISMSNDLTSNIENALYSKLSSDEQRLKNVLYLVIQYELELKNLLLVFSNPTDKQL